MKTKHIILFAFMFVCGCVFTFCVNNNNKSTPMEFLPEKNLEPPKVEMPDTVSIYDDPNLETIYVVYTGDTGKSEVIKEQKCNGCHWRCEYRE
jgi:PBP1b-binding outer membrane lipoprotein LpoB